MLEFAWKWDSTLCRMSMLIRTGWGSGAHAQHLLIGVNQITSIAAMSQVRPATDETIRESSWTQASTAALTFNSATRFLLSFAEFWNTASSIPIVLSGMWGVYMGYQYGYRARFVVPSFLMIIVGLGSIGFHVSGHADLRGQPLVPPSTTWLFDEFCVNSTIYVVLYPQGTLQYAGQALDELSMVGVAALISRQSGYRRDSAGHAAVGSQDRPGDH